MIKIQGKSSMGILPKNLNTVLRTFTLRLLLAGWAVAPTRDAIAYGETNETQLLYEQPVHLRGFIYALSDAQRKTPLFTFSRDALRRGNDLEVVREYRYPGGEVAAREKVFYRGDDLRSYELEELQIHAHGKATITNSAQNKKIIQFEYFTGKKAKKDREALPPDAVISDMIPPFLTAHWAALMNGQKVKCRYPVVVRAETIGFSFYKHGEASREGRALVLVRMEPTSRIISALVDPLEFVIEKEQPHRVLEYRGRTTPKLKSGKGFSELDGVTVFDWPQK